MASEDNIVIEIELDSKKFRGELKNLNSEAKKTSSDVGNSLDKNITDTINNSVNVSIKSMGKTMNDTSTSMSDSIGNFSFNMNQSIKAFSGLAATGTLFVPVIKNLSSINMLITDLSKILFKSKGFFGLFIINCSFKSTLL